jgi:membrane-bound lytic murein transglycosylase C
MPTSSRSLPPALLPAFFALVIALGTLVPGDAAADTMQERIERAQQGMRKQYGDAQQHQLDEFEKMSARMEKQFDELQQRMEAQQEQLRQRVARQWTDVRVSTQRTWVDYGERTDARSKVDFEKGEVEVEVLVPVEEVSPGRSRLAAPGQLTAQELERLRRLAEEKLREQTQRLVMQAEPPRQKDPERPAPPPRADPKDSRDPKSRRGSKAPPPVLQGQIAGDDGRPVTSETAGRFVHEQLAPKMVVDPKPVVGGDGQARIQVRVSVPLVPAHLKVRADRYASQVKAQAERLGVDPALVFAVIHTESSFNPMAHSGAGAYGLMQLIPKSAAFEAYKHLYKTEKLVTPEYLYDPENNITLGATYLKLLDSAFFGKLKSRENGQVLSIAAYNCGPTKIKKTVMKGRDLDRMTPEQVVALVRQLAPEETKNYVVRVRERMELYRGM